MSAVGEMLLYARGITISQKKIRDIIGEPSDSKTLANALNRFDNSDDGLVWRGLFLGDIKELKRLYKRITWEQNYRKLKCRKVLLITEIFVGSNKNIELG